jgi:hypothetical protein
VAAVVTKSRLDIEGELEELRRLAYGENSEDDGRGESSAKVLRLESSARASVPSKLLRNANGMVVDLRFVGTNSDRPAVLPAVARVELEQGKQLGNGKNRRRRVIRLELELEEEFE